VGSCGLEPTPYQGARAKQECESFLGRPVRIVAVSNLRGLLESGPQYLGSTRDRKLAPDQGFEP
jgi:hypothetical protein